MGKIYRYRKKKPKTKKRPKYRSMVKTTGPGLERALPLGKTFKLSTRYVATNIVIDPGASGIASTHVFSMNGMYDPDITGVGHQPLGFDQTVGVMYNHYTVIASRARVSVFNRDTLYPINCILQLKDTATTSTDVDDIIENGLCRWDTIPPAGTGGAQKNLVINCSPTKFFGRKVLQDDIFRGSSSSNPSEQVYLHVVAAPTVATDTSDLRCTIEIEYTAILTEPIQLVGS